MKIYRMAEDDVLDYLNTVLSLEENEEINSYNIRWGVLLQSDSNGEYDPSEYLSSTLPYTVKICSPKDVILKNIDVEVVIDEYYWNACREDIEKVALMHSIVACVTAKKDKEGYPTVNDNGRVKLKLVKPDICYAGNSYIAELYGSDSVEVKILRHLKSYYSEVFNLI